MESKIKKPLQSSQLPGAMTKYRTMAKLEKGIGNAKPDSLAVRIPLTECIHNGSAITKDTVEIDTDSVLIQERKYKTSQQFERDGITFTVQLQQAILNDQHQKQYIPEFIFPMPSKILGIEQYDQGWTLNNFEQGTQWLERTTEIKFKPHAWENARFSDLDNAVDHLMTAKEWHDHIDQIWQSIEPSTRKHYGRLFKTKAGLLTGYTLNSRRKEGNRAVTHRFPFEKAYDKAQEIEDSRTKGNTWGMDYQPGQRKRHESQIRNNYWTESPLLNIIKRPTTLTELLTLYNDHNEIMTAYANRVLHEGYITLTPKSKIHRDMSKETPEQFIRNELFQILKDIMDGNMTTAGLTPAQIKAIIVHRANEAFGWKHGKPSKIKKIVDEAWQLIMPENDPSQTKLKL